MKKGIIILIIILIIAIVPIMLIISKYKAERNEVNKFNLEFEQYKDKTMGMGRFGDFLFDIRFK